jgi:hypothetical protein
MVDVLCTAAGGVHGTAQAAGERQLDGRLVSQHIRLTAAAHGISCCCLPLKGCVCTAAAVVRQSWLLQTAKHLAASTASTALLPPCPAAAPTPAVQLAVHCGVNRFVCSDQPAGGTAVCADSNLGDDCSQAQPGHCQAELGGGSQEALDSCMLDESSIINHHQIDVLASCERDWGGPQRICRELPAVFQSGWTSTPRCITNTARQQHTAQHAIMRRCPNCPSTQPAARNPRTCCPGRALLPCDAPPPVSLAATRLAERIVSSPYPRGVLRAARFLRHIDIKSGRGGFPQPSSSLHLGLQLPICSTLWQHLA